MHCDPSRASPGVTQPHAWRGKFTFLFGLRGICAFAQKARVKRCLRIAASVPKVD